MKEETFSLEYIENFYKYKINVEEARKIQRYISKNLKEKEVKDFNIIAALDCSYFKNKVITSIVFCDKKLKVIKEEYLIENVIFPYIPTLLFLREGPFMVKLIKKSKIEADVYLIDGQGKAHPLKAGLACYVGFLIQKPVIGIAKSKLIGEIRWKNNEGSIVHENEIVGKAIKICNNKYFISIGNNISLESALNIFKKCIKGCHCFPLLKAHELATSLAKKFKRSQSFIN